MNIKKKLQNMHTLNLSPDQHTKSVNDAMISVKGVNKDRLTV